MKLDKVLTYQWKVLIPKTIWPFDTVTHLRLRDNLKNLYFHHQQIYDQ